LATIIVFDIDQTLLYTGGAGTKAMTRAFQEVFGVSNGFAGVEFSGRTDMIILRDAFRAHNIGDDFQAQVERFKERYFPHLDTSLRETEGSLMPGVERLLAGLDGRPDVVVGVATGNFRYSAELKLRHYGICDRFRGGAYADDAAERSDIVRLAVQRLAEGAGDASRALVVGDTPHDLTAAKASGGVAVGVATGDYSVEELRRSGADIALPDFSDWQGAIAQLLGQGR
jgi:phosphoglycolate phosphatase-like HAD superfamily hydrolase